SGSRGICWSMVSSLIEAHASTFSARSIGRTTVSVLVSVGLKRRRVWRRLARASWVRAALPIFRCYVDVLTSITSLHDPRHAALSFSPRGLRQAEIPDDRAVVSEHHVALVRRPDGEAAAALDVGILFARQLGRPPIELELARRFWPQLGHAMPS